MPGESVANPPPLTARGRGAGHFSAGRAAPGGALQRALVYKGLGARLGGGRRGGRLLRAGRQLLESLGLRERKNVDLIACPSCGRAEVDVIAVANDAQKALESAKQVVGTSPAILKQQLDGNARRLKVGNDKLPIDC